MIRRDKHFFYLYNVIIFISLLNTVGPIDSNIKEIDMVFLNSACIKGEKTCSLL